MYGNGGSRRNGRGGGGGRGGASSTNDRGGQGLGSRMDIDGSTLRGRPANGLGSGTQRGRSRSPRRQAIENNARSREEPGEEDDDEVDQRDQEIRLADPFAKLQGGPYPSQALRDPRLGPPLEYAWPLNGTAPTDKAVAIRQFVQVAAKSKFTAHDIDGYLFEDLNDDQAEIAATNMGIVNAHAAARMYRQTYNNVKFENDVGERLKGGRVGVVALMPVKTQLADPKVGINDLDRSNGVHGPSSDKMRTVAIIKRERTRALVLYGTSTRPNSQFMHEFVYFVHQDYNNQDPGMKIAVVSSRASSA